MISFIENEKHSKISIKKAKTQDKNRMESIIESEEKIHFEMTPNQLFISTFLSPSNQLNSLFLYHSDNSNKKSLIVTIGDEMCQTFLIKNKYIIIVASIKEIKQLKKHFFNQDRLIQNEHEQWNIDECISSPFICNEIKKKISKQYYLKNEIIIQIQNVIDKYYKFFSYIEFTIYAETCIMGERLLNKKQLQIQKIKDIFDENLFIIDAIENICCNQENKIYESTNLILSEIIQHTDKLRLLLLSSRPITKNLSEIIIIINLLRKNNKESLIHVNDIFDEKDEFIPSCLLSKKECGKSLLKRYLYGYIYYIKSINSLQNPFHLYQKSSINQYSVKHIDGKIIENHTFHSIQPYLSNITDYQEKYYLQTMDEKRRKKISNLFLKETFSNQEKEDNQENIFSKKIVGRKNKWFNSRKIKN